MCKGEGFWAGMELAELERQREEVDARIREAEEELKKLFSDPFCDAKQTFPKDDGSRTPPHGDPLGGYIVDRDPGDENDAGDIGSLGYV